MSKIYQGKNVSQGYKKIENLEDIGKIYKEYYANLLNHKANRLNKRKQMIYQTLQPANDHLFYNHFDSSPRQVEDESIMSANDELERKK